jgi:hypothetical protein
MNENKSHTPNSTYPKGGVSYSKDSFVVNQTFQQLQAPRLQQKRIFYLDKIYFTHLLLFYLSDTNKKYFFN